MSNLKHGDLEIIFEKGEINKVKWTGKSNDRNPLSFLTPYFEGILDDCKGKELKIIFSELDFMNSSTVYPIIDFIKAVNSNDIKTSVIFDKDSQWQVVSFKALGAVCSSMDNVEIIGE